MKRILGCALGLCLSAGAGLAGGVDRSGLVINPIFETGNYAEIGFGRTSPDISGTAAPAYGGFGSGNMVTGYFSYGGALKYDFNDRVSAALIFDQPYGAKVEYPAGTGYILGGSTATLHTSSLTLIGRYRFNDRIAVHAGIRNEALSGRVDLFQGGVANYSLRTNTDRAWGWLVGASYEIPDIALRAAITYNSRIDHRLDTLEGPNANTLVVADTMKTSMPESVNIDFQTGIMKDTLLLAGLRWVNWPQFEVAPAHYPLNPLVGYEHATWSWSLGLGHRFTEHFAGSVILGYEPQGGGLVANLGPHDGYKSITLGGRYTRGRVQISGGVRYVWVGDATTRYINSDFSGNHAVGYGLRIGYSF